MASAAADPSPERLHEKPGSQSRLENYVPPEGLTGKVACPLWCGRSRVCTCSRDGRTTSYAGSRSTENSSLPATLDRLAVSTFVPAAILSVPKN